MRVRTHCACVALTSRSSVSLGIRLRCKARLGSFARSFRAQFFVRLSLLHRGYVEHVVVGVSVEDFSASPRARYEVPTF